MEIVLVDAHIDGEGVDARVIMNELYVLDDMLGTLGVITVLGLLYHQLNLILLPEVEVLLGRGFQFLHI